MKVLGFLAAGRGYLPTTGGSRSTNTALHVLAGPGLA